MPNLDGQPNLAVEQAPQQLQNLVAGCNAFLASLSSVSDALQAAKDGGPMMANGPGQQLEAAMNQAAIGQQALLEATQASMDDSLTDAQVDAVDTAADTLARAAEELSGTGEISAETRENLMSSSAQLSTLAQDVASQAQQLQSPLSPNASDADLADRRALREDLSAQAQTIDAARTMVDAAASLGTPVEQNQLSTRDAMQQVAAEAQAEVDAKNAEEVERRVEERMARDK